MRFVGAILALAVIAATTIGQSFAADPQGARTSRAAQIVWFSGEESQGLRQDAEGNLVTSRQQLALRKPVAKLCAAAYYPDVGTLVTVDGDAVTRLYEKTGTLLELTQTRPPHEPEDARQRHGHIRPIAVRFCKIPGLVYLTWSYPEPRSLAMVQTSWQHSERLALGARARGWHAVTTENPKVKFLEYTYQVPSRKSVHLIMPDGKQIIVRLPDQLAEHRGPSVEREPVFVVPGRAIFCQTRGGWSMHDFKGNPIRYFPSPRRALGSWREPFYHNGHFYVSEVMPGWSYYRFDVERGKMTYVGAELPQQKVDREATRHQHRLGALRVPQGRPVPRRGPHRTG